MTAAWVIIGLLVLGLPLLAWWVGGRRVWGRLRPGAEPDPWRDAVRTQGLTAAEAGLLAREVPRGHRFDDPRLRRAAVDWAGTLLAQMTPRPRTRRGRVLFALALVWAAGVVVLLLTKVLMARPAGRELGDRRAVRRPRDLPRPPASRLRRTVAVNTEQSAKD